MEAKNEQMLKLQADLERSTKEFEEHKLRSWPPRCEVCSLDLRGRELESMKSQLLLDYEAEFRERHAAVEAVIFVPFVPSRCEGSGQLSPEDLCSEERDRIPSSGERRGRECLLRPVSRCSP
jgi:hypothetical protein